MGLFEVCPKLEGISVARHFLVYEYEDAVCHCFIRKFSAEIMFCAIDPWYKVLVCCPKRNVATMVPAFNSRRTCLIWRWRCPHRQVPSSVSLQSQSEAYSVWPGPTADATADAAADAALDAKPPPDGRKRSGVDVMNFPSTSGANSTTFNLRFENKNNFFHL
jgi:hypothetical protein